MLAKERLASRKLAEKAVLKLYKQIKAKKPKFVWFETVHDALDTLQVCGRLSADVRVDTIRVVDHHGEPVPGAVPEDLAHILHSDGRLLDQPVGGVNDAVWVATYRQFIGQVCYCESDTESLNTWAQLCNNVTCMWPYENYAIMVD